MKGLSLVAAVVVLAGCLLTGCDVIGDAPPRWVLWTYLGGVLGWIANFEYRTLQECNEGAVHLATSPGKHICLPFGRLPNRALIGDER